MKNKNKKKEIFSSYFLIKNKRGNLLPEEVLKIIIAVICIGFLVFLLVSLYFSVTGTQKTKEAEAVLKGEHGISKEIERINLGGGRENPSFFVPNPSEWYVFSFVGGEVKPNLCTGQNCICICESVLININIFDLQKRQINKCDDKGSCFVVSNLKKFEKIKIEKGGTFISISAKDINGQIQISTK